MILASAADEMQNRLLFIICSPRSGSTLLQRLLGSHSDIFTHPEPHLLTPLAHLGYYHKVEKAPYHHVNAARAIRDFVDHLPAGEEDYREACLAYSDTLYRRMLATSDKLYFLDKTPAYALIADFVTKLYPKARYIVLTRHPVAVLTSYAHAFFDGDLEAAQSAQPILDRYVPAIARFLRADDVAKVHVKYEELVRNPELELGRIFRFLDLEDQRDVIEYGRYDHISGLGDPKIDLRDKPDTGSVEQWASELAEAPEMLRIVQGIIAGLSPADLESWGYPATSLLDRVAEHSPAMVSSRRVNPYGIKRKLVRKLRRNIHRNKFGRVVKVIRDSCNALLRE